MNLKLARFRQLFLALKPHPLENGVIKPNHRFKDDNENKVQEERKSNSNNDHNDNAETTFDQPSQVDSEQPSAKRAMNNY